MRCTGVKIPAIMLDASNSIFTSNYSNQIQMNVCEISINTVLPFIKAIAIGSELTRGFSTRWEAGIWY